MSNLIRARTGQYMEVVNHVVRVKVMDDFGYLVDTALGPTAHFYFYYWGV